MDELLSFDALQWLMSVGYGQKTHEERMVLIKAAKIAYPNENEQDTIDFDKRV